MHLALVVSLCGNLWEPSTIKREDLALFPHGGSVWSILETLDPFAITNRIDVAGIESGTFGVWGVRGSSWTQNLVRLDGVDLTDVRGGFPLFYPDVESLEDLTLASAGRGPAAATPGAELQLRSREAVSSFEGSGLLRFTGGALQSSNLTEELVDGGVEPRELGSFPAARLEAGGRGVYGALYGFRIESRAPRFPGTTESSLFSGTGKLVRGKLSLLGIVQRRTEPTYGAAPGVAREATLDAQETFEVAQARWSERAWHASIGWARGDLETPFSGGGTPAVDLARGEVWAAPLQYGRSTRNRLNLVARAERGFGRHALRGGAEYSRGSLNQTEAVPGNLERLFVDGAPHAVSFFQGEGQRDIAVSRFALHVDDTFRIKKALTLSPGVRFDVSRAPSVHWTSVTPSVSGTLPLTASGQTILHASFARYPHALTSRFSEAALPTGLSFVWRRWSDTNGDLLVSPQEIGSPLRRRGPAFTSVASDLPRPVTDELTFGVEKRFRSGRFFMGAYHRRDKNLLETVQVGIRPESYVTFQLPDVGPDGSAGTDDDSVLTLFDQRAQFGEDRFILDHPEGLTSFSQGVDMLLFLEGRGLTFALSGRAYRDQGSAGTGNTVGENDTGLIGSLYDDPNTLVNGEGRLFFDRAFTGKLHLTAKAPGALDVAAVLRYWDGLPFARQIYLPDVGQGFTVVQAFPRGRLRYTYNMTLDVRVTRAIALGKKTLGLEVDVFNLVNQALETEEFARTGAGFRRPTAVQPARTVRLGARLRF